MATITVTRDSWLAEAGKLSPPDRLYMNPRGDLTQIMALEALEAQYGVGVFDTWQHGQSLRIMRGLWKMPFADSNGGLWSRYEGASRAYSQAKKNAASDAELEELRDRLNAAHSAWNKARVAASAQKNLTP